MSTLMSQARNRVPRFAEAAVERARLSVVPRGTTQARRAPFVVLVLAMLAAGVVGLLTFNTNMQQDSFYETSLQGQAATLVAKQQSLELQVEQLRDPQRLAIAGKKLGMVVPESPAFVELGTGRILGTPTPALPQDSMRINPLPQRKPADLAPPPLIIKVQPPAQAQKTIAQKTAQKKAQKKSGNTSTTSTGGTRGTGRKNAGSTSTSNGTGANR